MTYVARIAWVLFSVSLCAVGIVIAYRSPESVSHSVALDPNLLTNAYEPVAHAPRESAYGEFESIIRRHSTVKSYHGRIEFGSVNMEGANAVVQVLFFAPDGSMTPFFYVLSPKNKTWKVETVQRIWFEPRSHLLRGLRV
jgi:hypothetical protein